MSGISTTDIITHTYTTSVINDINLNIGLKINLGSAHKKVIWQHKSMDSWFPSLLKISINICLLK